MTVLIMGGSGFLGTELVRQAMAAGWAAAATFHSRPGSLPGAAWHEVDLRNPVHIERVLAEVAPSVVVNATSGLADWAVTAEGSIRVALAAVKLGVRLVHATSRRRPHLADHRAWPVRARADRARHGRRHLRRGPVHR